MMSSSLHFLAGGGPEHQDASHLLRFPPWVHPLIDNQGHALRPNSRTYLDLLRVIRWTLGPGVSQNSNFSSVGQFQALAPTCCSPNACNLIKGVCLTQRGGELRANKAGKKMNFTIQYGPRRHRSFVIPPETRVALQRG